MKSNYKFLRIFIHHLSNFDRFLKKYNFSTNPIVNEKSVILDTDLLYLFEIEKKLMFDFKNGVSIR